MNHVLRQFKDVEFSSGTVQEALHCILHTVIFARFPGKVCPRDITGKALRVSYTTCGDPEAHAKVNEALQSFMSTLEQKGPDLHKGFVTITFYKIKKTRFAFFVE